jgi:archaellum component FlaF (FlaF/FlaG flagellin family)
VQFVGFSTVTTHVILFVAAIGIATGLLFGIKNFSDNAESTFKMKSDDYSNKIKTSIQIEVVHYDNVTNTTSIYVKNTGQTMLKPEQIDVYIDGVRLSRNDGNRTIEIMSDTDSINAGIFDPKEEILILVPGSLDVNKTHEVIITTQYETKDTEVFSP